MRTAVLWMIALSACGGGGAPTLGDASLDGFGSDASTSDLGASESGASDAALSGVAELSVGRYEYALDLTSRALRATLRARVRSGGRCVRFSLQREGVSAVSVDGVPAREAAVRDGTLELCHPSDGFRGGSEVVIEVQGEVPSETWSPTQVGFSRRNNRAGRRFTYALSWVGQCGRIGPCDASPDRFARYELRVTHPEGTQVLCPGEITAGALETRCVFDRPGGPAYSTIGVLALNGGWTRGVLGAVGGVSIVTYDTAAARLGGALDASHATGFLGWMVERFGPYPYGDELRVIAAPTYWSGFEHPGNIAIAETLVGNPALEHTYRHEVAHQWAGDLTTLSTERDFVWKEAMAEYLAFVYEDERVSSERATETLRRWRESAARADHYPVPASPLPLVEYYGSAYGPGPMIFFRQLEVMTSRRQVMEAIASLLGRERAISVDDVRVALERSTGVRLDGYLRAWLQGDGAPSWPAVDVQHEAVGAELRLRVEVQTRDQLVRPCHFHVRLTGVGDAQLDVPVRVGGHDPTPVTRMVRPGFEVTGVVVDPRFEAMVFPAVTPDGARWIARGTPARFDPFRAPDELSTRGR